MKLEKGKYIYSFENNFIKRARALKRSKERENRGEFIAEGIRVITEGLSSGFFPCYVLYCDNVEEVNGGRELLTELKFKGIPCYKVEKKLFTRTAATEKPQGVLGVYKIPSMSINDIPWNDPELFLLIADNVSDPGNLGTIIRTAFSCGCTSIVCTKGSVDAYNPKVIRSTAGMIFKIPVLENVESGLIIEYLHENKLKLVAADLQGEKMYFEADLNGKIALAVGNESRGLSKDIYKSADERARIPITEKSESLNVSIAAGIFLSEVLRQRYMRKKR